MPQAAVQEPTMRPAPAPNPSPGPQNGQKPTPLPCRYKTGKTLGQGTYSVVKEAVHIETGKCYAAKIINKRLMSGREHMARNEIVVLRRISKGHKNVLTLVDYFETANNLYLVTDLAKGGELFDRIYKKGSFYESDAASIVRSITSGVAYLHSHGIVHRDLKPENLLFLTPDENSDLLIADFGLSRIIDEEKFRMLTTTCGTPGYMAPEIFNKSGHGKAVDIWAIGVITYFLLCGYTPFDSDTSAEEMQAILDGNYSFEPEEYWQDVSEGARDFITKCLQVDASNRMSAEDALKHEFLKSKHQNDETDLLPNVKSNFNLRKLQNSLDTSRVIDGAMDGAYSQSPENARPLQRTPLSGSSKTSREPSRDEPKSKPNSISEK